MLAGIFKWVGNKIIQYWHHAIGKRCFVTDDLSFSDLRHVIGFVCARLVCACLCACSFACPFLFQWDLPLSCEKSAEDIWAMAQKGDFDQDYASLAAIQGLVKEDETWNELYLGSDSNTK